MGRDKAMVDVGGRTAAQRVVDAASPIGEILVVGRTGTLAGATAVADDMPARLGPLAGLVTALRNRPGRPVLLIAVDQPFARTATLEALVIRHDGIRVTVPVADGWRQVACAVYPPTASAQAELALTDGGSLADVCRLVGTDDVAEAEWRSWGEDGRSWFSIDDPQALAEGLGRYGIVA